MQEQNRPDLVLVQAPAWGVWTPPLALASLSSFLRKQGYSVLVLDINGALYSKRGEKYKNAWELEQEPFWNNPSLVDEFLRDYQTEVDDYVKKIIESGAAVIGFSIYSSSKYISNYLAKKVKDQAPWTKIIYGGPGCADFCWGNYLIKESFVDAIVKGEGEITLLDIVKRVGAGEPFEDIPGTLLKKEGKVIDCGEREIMVDMNDLPFPDFDDFDFRIYRNYGTLPIATSRGCANRCIFCNDRPFWKRFRFKRGELIFQEIECQLKRYPYIKKIEFFDSLVNGNIKALETMADLIIESGIKIQWSGQAVIRKEMTYELLKKLKDSGCTCLAYGLETPSTSLMLKIGKALSKGCDPEKIVQDGYRAGITGCSINFMFGLPGETEEDAQETLDFLKRNKDYIGTVCPSVSFCGFGRGTLVREDPDKYDVDLKKGDLYWETKDGKNNYLIRMERFERFCRLVDELKISTIYPHPKLMNRNQLLGDYYRTIGVIKQAIEYYQNAILFEGKNVTMIKKLAACYKDIKNDDLFKECQRIIEEMEREGTKEKENKNLTSDNSKDVEKADANERNNVEAISKLVEVGEHLYVKGFNKEAMELFLRLAQIEPENAAIWNKLGMVCNSVCFYDQALACFNKALYLQPRFQEAANNLHQLKVSQKSAEDREACLTTSLTGGGDQ